MLAKHKNLVHSPVKSLDTGNMENFEVSPYAKGFCQHCLLVELFQPPGELDKKVEVQHTCHFRFLSLTNGHLDPMIGTKPEQRQQRPITCLQGIGISLGTHQRQV